ncbi:MAG: DUF1254 domain-containing protein [Xanthobacteraceae bacterium]|nr:DUF1254 domain-containing protein [Xanthobacteraceae bacterium]
MVAINVDTVYASAYLDLTDEPLVLTVPSTPVNYSILALDSYGDTYATGLQPNTPGVYALIGPGGFPGTLPADVTQTVALSLMCGHWVIAASGVNPSYCCDPGAVARRLAHGRRQQHAKSG